LAFTGSATHGGGSCQVSITYDAAPNKNSVWKVIHSIEGGCPIKNVAGNNGNDASAVNPDTYSFTVPTTLPTGSAVLAWTWFNKVGNREMYMNCAPITLTGSGSKREFNELETLDLEPRNATQLIERDINAYNALPDMFVANIGNGCGTKDSTDLLFPNPGNSVEQDGLATSSALAAPTGSCQSAAGAISAIKTSAIATSAAAVKTSVPGGVFITTAAPVAVTTAVASKVSSAAPVIATTVASAKPAATTAASSSPVTTVGAQAVGSACSTEGQWNCIAGTSFQRCASGTWSAVMAVSGGTTCTAGISSTLNIAAISKKKHRAIRFSNEHVRRHAHRSS
jgi:hypothetical protein